MPRNSLDWARLLAIAAAVAIVFSIAVKEILLGAALVALLASRQRWRMPAGVTLPLLLFAAGTLAALLLSPDPRAGLPQVKKFYAYLILPVLTTALRSPADARLTLCLCLAAGVLSSLWSFIEFAQRWREAAALHVSFYLHYIAQRTTGFMSHWQTFGGQLCILTAIALAFLLFARPKGIERRAAATTAALLFAALVLNLTRGIYIATGAAVLYLVWMWRPRFVFALPLLALAALTVQPVRQRALSLWQPQGEVDSNTHRLVTWRTGLAMIKAHPLAGVGPDRVDDEFQRYLPADVKRLPEGWYGHLHNTYLQYAADRGLPVLACFLWFLYALLAGPLKALRTAPDPWLAHAGVAAWLGVMVTGLFEANLANSEVLHLFLVTMVCAWQAVPSSGVPLKRPD